MFFSDGFWLGNIERKPAPVPFLNMMCIIIRTKAYVKVVFEQTCALYYWKQNMKEKWQYFHLFATLWEFVNICDVIYEKLLDNDD